MGRNQWQFGNVSHYGRMLVVCHALQGPNAGRPCTWIYDGETLAQHLPSGHLDVTPLGVWDNPSKGRLLGKCDAGDLETCARETAQLLMTLLERDDYPRTTMQDAQWTLEHANHFAEYASLHMLTQRADPAVCTLALPEEQQPHHDLVETCTATGAVQKLQGKTAQPYWRKTDGKASAHATTAGLHVSLKKNIGETRKRVRMPPTISTTWWSRGATCDAIGGTSGASPWPKSQSTNKRATWSTPSRCTCPWTRRCRRASIARPCTGHARASRAMGGRGELNKSYDWSIQYHESFEMDWAWEPPVPWPAELEEHMRRRKLRLKQRP